MLNSREFDFQQVNQQVCQWQKVYNKVQKTIPNVAPNELVELFNFQIQTLKKHISVKCEQNKFCNHLKEHLEEVAVLIHVDYGENNPNKEQQETQSAYFGHETFSIFLAYWYFRENDGKLKTRNVTVTSEAKDHFRIVAHTCVIKVLEEVTKEMPAIIKVYLWSEGCAAQFCSRFVFHLILGMDEKYDITWCCNELHYGKGPRDGIGGTVKISVFLDLKSRKVQITSAEFFASYAD